MYVRDDRGERWIYAAHPVNAEGAGGMVAASFVSVDSVLASMLERPQKMLADLLGTSFAAILLV
jgi:hypothetical protein